jgi:hydroxymethylpyrimidine kinase/phosphomethylpyrimidine kinase
MIPDDCHAGGIMSGDKKLKQILQPRPFRSILIKPRIYKALTVAGSDPSGGAGIQADLKTFANFEVFGSAVITALTAQNTVRVTGIHPVPPEFIRLQMEAVLDDLGPQPVKTGMIPDSASIRTVLEVIRERSLLELVVDPVLVATSGDALVTETTVEDLKALIGAALLVTPNLEEASRLTGVETRNIDDMKEAALQLYQTGVKNVLIKGGHLLDDATDLYFDGKEFVLLKEKKIPVGPTHGTGCAYAAAITAGLAKGMSLLDAVINGKIFVTRALKFALEVGQGSRVLNFHV